MKKVLGIVDNVNVCDKCGRQDLQKTVAIDSEGEVAYFGVVCASYVMKQSTKDILKQIKTEEDKKYKKEMKEWSERRKKEFDVWQEFLNMMAPSHITNTFLQIEHLGGYTKARALFKGQ